MPRAKRTPDVPADRLDEMLVRLKLAGIRDQLDSLLDEAARSNLSTRETLAMLCEREIARKDHRRIDMALRPVRFELTDQTRQAIDEYEKLQKALKAEINEEAWETLYSAVSHPFKEPASGKIAVKVINHYGDEVLKVYDVRDAREV